MGYSVAMLMYHLSALNSAVSPSHHQIHSALRSHIITQEGFTRFSGTFTNWYLPSLLLDAFSRWCTNARFQIRRYKMQCIFLLFRAANWRELWPNDEIVVWKSYEHEIFCLLGCLLGNIVCKDFLSGRTFCFTSPNVPKSDEKVSVSTDCFLEAVWRQNQRNTLANHGWVEQTNITVNLMRIVHQREAQLIFICGILSSWVSSNVSDSSSESNWVGSSAPQRSILPQETSFSFLVKQFISFEQIQRNVLKNMSILFRSVLWCWGSVLSAAYVKYRVVSFNRKDKMDIYVCAVFHVCPRGTWQQWTWIKCMSGTSR